MINVFYRPEQSVASNKSYSPSAGKPALVFDDWTGNEEIAPFVKVRSFDPLTVEQIAVAHDLSYVKGIFDGSIPNGFNNTSKEVAESLKYTTGSMYAAAKHAIENQTAAFSLTSGFHHAGYNYGGGYCTFNGLMITALLMQKLGLAKHILIIDGDAHYGDGTDDIIQRTNAKHIRNITAMRSYNNIAEFYRNLDVKSMVKYYNSVGADQPDLVLYQAGADAWNEDPLNAGIFSMEELFKRDQVIFQRCKAGGIPIAANLAGGYSRHEDGGIEPVLKIHRQTIKAAIGRYCFNRLSIPSAQES